MLRLLITNYTMSSTHSVLSHQSDCVRNLSPYFEQVFVLTGSCNSEPPPENVNVVNANWDSNARVQSIFRFLKNFWRIVIRFKPQVVFSHMTTLQSVLMGPILRLLRIRHVMWYAHTSSSFLLRIAYLFSDSVVTSTVGSFPWQGKKVVAIGLSLIHI